MDLNDLKVGLMTLTFIAFIIGSMAIAISQFRLSEINAISPTAVVNEALTLDNATAVSVGNSWVQSVSSIEVNRTGSFELLATANYTVTGLNGEGNAQVTLTNNAYDGNVSRVNYTYRDIDARPSVNVSSFGIQGTNNSMTFLPTIGTLMGVAVLVMLALGAFMFARR